MKTWDDVFRATLNTPSIKELKAWLKEERKTKQIYPGPNDLFNAFRLTPWNKVKVVILGQEPHCTPFTAHGLAYSSLQPIRLPVLNNIFVEVWNDYFKQSFTEADLNGVNAFKSNNLTEWAEQGVLLLNTILTVEEKLPLSHAGKGWEEFTAHIIKQLNNHDQKLVFILWGKGAQEYGQFLDPKKHLILTAASPSAKTADKGFFGCAHFTKANEWIEKYNPNGNKCSINWGIWKK